MSGTRLFAAEYLFGADSPNRYSSMLTKTKRFADPHRDGVDFYECEFGTKKSIDRNVQGGFPLCQKMATLCFRCADRSALGQPHGTCKGLAGPVNCRADSPIKYSNVRSSKERLGSMQGPLNAADYNTDTAGKQFIATGLEGTAAASSTVLRGSLPSLCCAALP